MKANTWAILGTLVWGLVLPRAVGAGLNANASLGMDVVSTAGDTLVVEVTAASIARMRVVELMFRLPEGMDLVDWRDGGLFPDALRIGPTMDAAGVRALVALATKGSTVVTDGSGTVGTAVFVRTGGGEELPELIMGGMVDDQFREDYLVDATRPVHPSPPAGETRILPARFLLRSVSPNPISTHAAVEFEVPRPGSDVRIRIYDVQGRVVRTLTDGHRAAGYYSEVWDLTNAAGQHIAPGIYFCRMEAGSFRDTKKVVLLQ